jgi:hypothetical protein
MRNKELVDRRFDQIDGKLKTLKFLLGRQSTAKEFTDEVNGLQDIVDDLRSLVDKDENLLRRG